MMFLNKPIESEYSVDTSRLYDTIAKERGILQSPRFTEQFRELYDYYGMYDGSAQKRLVNEMTETNINGAKVKIQSYQPVIENHIKPCIDKEASFAFGKPFKAIYTTQTNEDLTELNYFLNKLIKTSKLYSNITKGYKNASIAKRVLLRLDVNNGKYTYTFHDSMSFDYETDDEGNITALFTASAFDKGNDKLDIVWSAMKLEDGIAWYEGGTVDERTNKAIVTTPKFWLNNNDTPLTYIPAWLIANNNLIDDEGVSDIDDVKEQQILINQLKSDATYSIKYGQFEPYVAINLQPKLDRKGKPQQLNMSPNSIIDFQSALDQQFKFEPITKEFNWRDTYNDSITEAKQYIYSVFGIPNRSDLTRMNSGLSQRMMYTDLINRCDVKVAAWHEALKASFLSALEFAITDGIVTLPANVELEDIDVIISNEYNVVEDELANREFRMKEVLAGVRSIRSYLSEERNMTNVENELEEIKATKEIIPDMSPYSIINTN